MSPTSRTATHPHRFRDPRRTRLDFLDSVLVRCPDCDEAAHIAPAPSPPGEPAPGLFVPRRLVCRTCGTAKESRRGGLAFRRDPCGSARDPYFGARLWLQTETRHGWVWAYNLEHLDLLKRFVQAQLREGIPWNDHGRKMTVVARLPAWMQQAKNRDEVLRAIARIHATVL
ncbi:hypothetical protein [Streptomyces venezuelae]|uniref:hypothetical protein n=1 Tax=Streptomyces venezuelae TaxID=54571 RepID=UPI00168761D3|nr:hypothetical protein [Streptomyces venezuelae]